VPLSARIKNQFRRGSLVKQPSAASKHKIKILGFFSDFCCVCDFSAKLKKYPSTKISYKLYFSKIQKE
jgi:hypothetical protein